MARLCALAVLLFGVGIVCAVDYDFGIVVDAGSTSSRLYVYKWIHRTLNGTTPEGVIQVANQRNNAPLDSFVVSQAGLPAFLSGFVAFAKANVPADRWSETSFYLAATASMRALPQASQDSVINAINGFMNIPANNPFLFRNGFASVISGGQEGFFGWIAANYLASSLGSASTFGYLDMGGVSTQIAFVPSTAPAQNSFDLSFFGRTYATYAQSLNNFGQDQFVIKYTNYITRSSVAGDTVASPCHHLGYNTTVTNRVSNITANIYGVGDTAACRTAVLALLGLSDTCAVSPCSVNGTYTPSIGSTTFYAVSGFYFTANFFFPDSALAARQVSIDEVTAAGDEYCTRTWSNVTTQWNTTSPAFLSIYCLTTRYHRALLGDAYHLNTASESDIIYQNAVNGTSTGFQLGAIIYNARLSPLQNLPGSTTGTPSTTGVSSTTGASSGYVTRFSAVLLAACVLMSLFGM